MNRFFFADLKKIAHAYYVRTMILLIPFIQVIGVSCALIFMNVNKKYIHLDTLKKILFYTSIATICIIILSVIISAVLIHSHKKNTFIEVGDNCLIISIYSQVVINKFKPVYFNRLYVLDYINLDCIRLNKGKIQLFGKIKCYYDKSENLRYTFSKTNQISFDKWWYNNNPASDETFIELPNKFCNTAKALTTARKLAINSKADIIRKNYQKDNLLRLAMEARKKRQNRIQRKTYHR